jgi:hypothetical protein
VPANVTDAVDETVLGVVPNGDWCSLMRSFNLEVETSAVEGQVVKTLLVSPKEWTVQLQLEIPSGKFITNLGKGQCTEMAIRKVTDTQVALVFTNNDKFHAAIQRVRAINGSSLSICNILQSVSVPPLGTYTFVLPPCDNLVVTVEYPTTAAMTEWQGCSKSTRDNSVKSSKRL